MGRWGWRRIAILCVLVWVMTACDLLRPAPTLQPSPTSEATLQLRTRTVSPPSDTPRASSGATAPATRPSPQPQRTPGPAATPHFYTVQPGDSLPGIAARFGVSVQALREANGGLPPGMVTPGQILLIPPPETAFPTGTFVRFLPTHTPLPLELAPPTCYHTPADELICLGWVANTRPLPLVNVAVQVALRDASGGTAARHATAIIQAVVPPEDGAPYAARFPAPPAYSRAEAALLSAEEGDPATLRVVALTVTSLSSEREGDIVWVRGVARQERQAPLADLLAVITLFDAEGRVTGYRAVRPPGTLVPGQTLTVNEPVIPLGAGTVRSWLHVEGRMVVEE